VHLSSLGQVGHLLCLYPAGISAPFGVMNATAFSAAVVGGSTLLGAHLQDCNVVLSLSWVWQSFPQLHCP
jgi:hypothetical protein